MRVHGIKALKLSPDKGGGFFYCLKSLKRKESDLMERTIGGAPISVVFEKLKGDIPNVLKYTDDKKPYLDVNVMRQHFESVVPLQNYDFTVTDLKYVETSTLEPGEKGDKTQQSESFSKTGNRACFTCIGTLTLYDDMGVKVVSKSHIGSCNVSFLKATGQAQDLAMDAKNAGIAAKKDCIKQFGCGDRQLEDAKASKKGNAARGTTVNQNQRPNVSATQSFSGANAGAPQASGAVMPSTGTGRFVLSLDESRQAKNTSTMIIHPVFCREYKNYRTHLVIWKNKVTKERLMEINNMIATGCEFTVQGKFELYGNEYRVVFYKMEGA